MDLFDHPGWRRVSPDTADPVFRRPLGHLELGFYWDVVHNGVAITSNHIELEADAGCENELFAIENVERAWLRMKQRFPLLGASIEELPGAEKVEFVLRESALYTLRPGELRYLNDLHSADAVAAFAEKLRNGPPVLDSEFLSRVWFGPQKDAPRRWHIFIPVVHYITDGIANATIVRELCQELSSLSKSAKIDAIPLAIRLQTVLPTEVHTPSAKLSLPHRRWRLAIAKVIRSLRQEKMTGGHTLPTLPVDADASPLSFTISIPLTLAESQQIMQTCRTLGITVGNALPVLSQLAFSRVLHRLRHQGKLNDEEWEHRRCQPMHYAGPVNYRPYLDRAWYGGGGADEVCIAITFYTLVLPFMPVPVSLALDETGAPPLHTLLSPARFLARARMARVQSKKLLAHPLMHEFHALRLTMGHERARTAAMAWRAKQQGRDVPAPAAQEPGKFASFAPCVFSNGGSSLGGRDHLIPDAYPLSSKAASPTPARLRILKVFHDLRCRTGELYLGATTTRGVLSFFTHVDASTYDVDLVREWQNEVKAAALVFLSAGLVKDNARREARL